MSNLKTPSSPEISFARRLLAGWLPLAVYTGLVFRGALAQPRDIPSFFLTLNDKVVHTAEFFFLFWFAANAFEKAKADFLKAHSDLLAFIYGLAVGAATEWLQAYVPNRSRDLLDFLADAGGLGLALALACACRMRRKSNGLL